MYVCDWSNFESEREHVRVSTLEGKRAANPFAFLMIGESLASS
jgi:hypothetical protein